MSANSGSSEYQRLYTLLSNLSSKTRVGPEPPVIPMISIFEDTTRSSRSNKTARHKRTDDGKETSKEALSVVKEEIKEEPPKRWKPIIGQIDDPIDVPIYISIDDKKARKQARKLAEKKAEKLAKKLARKQEKTFECSGCFKRYHTQEDLETHHGMTEMCRRWMALPNHEEYGTPALPIHMFLEELLAQSITGDNPLQCRFCKTTFVNIGNHHKHFYRAYVCNRLAFAECKQLLQTLQIEQRK